MNGYTELLDEAKTLASKVEFLDAQQISTLAERFDALPGGEGLAVLAIQTWLESFRQKHPDGIEVEEGPLWGGFRPEIRAGLLAMQKGGGETLSVLDAAIRIYERSGWGSREEAALKSSTVGDFEDILRNSPIRKFQTFMAQMTRLIMQADDYRLAFGDGITNFIEACRNVRKDSEAERLNKLVEDLFKGVGQLALLEPPA